MSLFPEDNGTLCNAKRSEIWGTPALLTKPFCFEPTVQKSKSTLGNDNEMQKCPKNVLEGGTALIRGWKILFSLSEQRLLKFWRSNSDKLKITALIQKLPFLYSPVCLQTSALFCSHPVTMASEGRAETPHLWQKCINILKWHFGIHEKTVLFKHIYPSIRFFLSPLPLPFPLINPLFELATRCAESGWLYGSGPWSFPLCELIQPPVGSRCASCYHIGLI